MSFREQLPALIGAVIGAAATYAVTSAAERSRWRREQSVRWDDRRALAYSEYGFAIKKVIAIAVRISAYRDAHSVVKRCLQGKGCGCLRMPNMSVS